MNCLAGHNISIIHELANSGSLKLSSETAEFSGSLSMAPAEPDTSRPAKQREDMTRAAQARNGSLGVSEDTACQGSVVGGDSGSNRLISSVDGDGVGSAAGVFGIGDHLGELELLGSGWCDGSADEA